MKTINSWSFVNLYNVMTLTGKPKTHFNRNVGWFSAQTHTNHNVGWFSPEPTPTIMWVIFIWTHTNHNVGWFSRELILTMTWDDFYPNSQSTTLGDLLLGTTWPTLLSGWKSPKVGILGLWVIFAVNLKVIKSMQKSTPHCWQFELAHDEPRFVVFWWWTGFTVLLSGLKVHVLNKMLWLFTTSARTTEQAFFAWARFLETSIR